MPPALSEPPVYAPPQGQPALQGNPIRSTPWGEGLASGPEWPSDPAQAPRGLLPWDLPTCPLGALEGWGLEGDPLNSSVLLSGPPCSVRGHTGEGAQLDVSAASVYPSEQSPWQEQGCVSRTHVGHYAWGHGWHREVAPEALLPRGQLPLGCCRPHLDLINCGSTGVRQGSACVDGGLGSRPDRSAHGLPWQQKDRGGMCPGCRPPTRSGSSDLGWEASIRQPCMYK